MVVVMNCEINRVVSVVFTNLLGYLHIYKAFFSGFQEKLEMLLKGVKNRLLRVMTFCILID